MHAALRNNGAIESKFPVAVSQGTAPNCDGEAPSATYVTALLSRIIRSSGTIRGVQCPIPPVHEPLPLQEIHP